MKSTFYEHRMRIGGVSVFTVQETTAWQFLSDDYTQSKTIIFAGTTTASRDVIIPASDGVEYNLINLCSYSVNVRGSVADANGIIVPTFSGSGGSISVVYCKGELSGSSQYVPTNSSVVAAAAALAGDVTGTLGSNKVTTITGTTGNVIVTATSFTPGGAFTWQMPSSALNPAYSVYGGAGNAVGPSGGSINEVPGSACGSFRRGEIQHMELATNSDSTVVCWVCGWHHGRFRTVWGRSKSRYLVIHYDNFSL
jgi:hypothetical protein